MKPHLLEVRPGRFDGEVRAPSSKSVTHRAFLIAAQSTVPCEVASPLLSADTRATLACLGALGARFHLDADRPDAVRFLPARFAPPRQALDCANSGTTLRLLAGTAARLGHPVTLTGDGSLRSRPNGALLAALGSLGAQVRSHDGRAPLTVQGPIRPGSVVLPPGASSQFASSLILSLPFLPGDSAVHLQPPVASEPYLDVTLDVASRAGLRIEEGPGEGRRFTVPGGQSVHASRLVVDGDWSSAAFPLVAAAVTGGRATVRGLDPQSRQGDRRIVELLESFGARVRRNEDGATVEGGALSSPGEVDVSATPDLFPVLCVVAACSRGRTRFTGGAALRAKETDRIAAMAHGLRAMGIEVRELPDGLEVEGGRLRGASVACRDDHRIHMAFAVAGLAAQGITRVDSPGMADVSYPGFHAAFQACGAPFNSLRGNRVEAVP